MKQGEKAARFAALHVKGAPLVLYNAWDAGSAKVVLEAGANAIDDSPGRFKLRWQKRESRRRREWRVMLGDLVASVSEGIQPSRRSCYQALAPLESSAARKERASMR